MIARIRRILLKLLLALTILLVLSAAASYVANVHLFWISFPPVHWLVWQPGDDQTVQRPNWHSGIGLDFDDGRVRLACSHISDLRVSGDAQVRPKTWDWAGLLHFEKETYFAQNTYSVATLAWFAPLLTGILPVHGLIWPAVRRRRRLRRHACIHCGYDLTGNVSGVCPECGCATQSLGKEDCTVGP